MNRVFIAVRAGMLLAPGLALAHAKLIRSVPARGSVLAAAPAQLTLVFDEPAQLTALSIRGSADTATTRLGPLPRDVAAKFRVALPGLKPGTYTVSWRVLSDDGHLMPGTLTFSVRTATARAMAQPEPAVSSVQ